MAFLATQSQPRTHETHRARPRLKWPSSLTFPLVLFLIIACFYWKLVFTYQFDWMWSPDLADQIFPWWQEAARQLQHGQFPLWDPHYWMGQPFLGQAQPGAAYPLNWLLWLLPRKHGLIEMTAINWYFVVEHYLAALFCYLLCRDLKRSRAASLIAGLAFALAGYIGGIDWPQMLNGAMWIPLVFLFLLRAARGVHPWSSASLSGACIGMAWLSGHHQAPIFLTVAAAGAWLYYIFKDGRPDWRMARLAAVAMVFAPVVGALQILPAQEYGRLAWRWAGARDHLGWDDVIPYYVHTKHAVDPMYLFGIVIPAYNERGAGVFVGVVAVSLALIGIIVSWRQHLVKFFGAIALAGLVYSLGGYSIFQGFIYAVIPFVEKARVPAAAMLLFDVGFAVLAAFGVDALLPLKESEEADYWIRRLNIGVAVFGTLLGATVLAIVIAQKFQWNFDDRVGMTVLISILMAALLYAWRTKNLTPSQALTLLTLLLLFEVGNQSSFMLADRNDSNRRTYLDRIWGNGDIAAFLQKQPGPFRVETQSEEDISRNWGDFNDIDFLTAQAGVTVNTFRLEPYKPSTKKLLGTKYTLARAAANPEQSEVFRGSSGVGVYQNPGVFSRAWTVHEIVPIHDVDQGQRFIDEHVDEMSRKALFLGESPPELPACAEAKDIVFVTNYAPSNVSVNADMTCGGLLVLSDTYYPGWYATVDGQPAPIYEVDLALRGVKVSKGAHVVSFQYRPRSVFWGASLTLAGVLGAAVIAFWSGKSRRLAPKHHH
jgi:Bacterial membrane protein YfhO